MIGDNPEAREVDGLHPRGARPRPRSCCGRARGRSEVFDFVAAEIARRQPDGEFPHHAGPRRRHHGLRGAAPGAGRRDGAGARGWSSPSSPACTSRAATACAARTSTRSPPAGGVDLRDRLRELSMGMLDGRVAIVTGAGTGLGLSIARALARRGRGDRGRRDRRALGPGGGRGALGARRRRALLRHRRQRERAGRRVVRRRARATSAASTSSSTTPASRRVGPHTQDVTDEDWHDSIAVMQTGRLLRHARRGPDHARPGTRRLDRQHLVDPRLLARTPGA